MTLQELPLEIIQKVFTYLDRRDLGNFLYIGSKWHHLVKPIYFEEVTWHTTSKIKWLKQCLKAMGEDDHKTQMFHQLPMTKQLCIHSDFDDDESNIAYDGSSQKSLATQLTVKELLYVLSLFPNLKQLDIMQSAHRDHYMQIICDSQPAELPHSLEEIVMNSEYTKHHSEDSRILSFAVCYRFRQSLKHMSVVYFDNLFFGRSFMEVLPDFKSLSTLEIYNDSDPNITLFYLLQICPSLSTLVYSSTFEIMRCATQQLRDMIQKVDKQNLTIPQFLNKLKKLKITLPTLTTPYIDFFMNHCPESLQDVDIYFTQTGIHQWIEDMTMNVIFDFSKSLQKFNSIQLMFAVEPIRDHQEIDTFHQILHALTGERNISTRSLVHKDSDKINAIGALICINGSELDYEYCFRIEGDNFTDEDFLEKNLHPVLSTSTLEQLAKVNNFKIWTDVEFENYISIPYISIPKHYLEYAKKYFPILVQFQVECGFAGRTLEAKCLYNDQSLKNMVHITLDGYEYPQDVLKDISDYFPRLEVLSFEVSHPFRTFNEKTILELSYFQSLHTIIIGIDYISRYNPDALFIRYTTDNSQHSTHYILKSKANGSKESKNYFEHTSEDPLQELIESEERRRTYTIYIECLDRLKRVELKNGDKAYASLDI